MVVLAVDKTIIAIVGLVVNSKGNDIIKIFFMFSFVSQFDWP
jgi:hypothetical protein